MARVCGRCSPRLSSPAVPVNSAATLMAANHAEFPPVRAPEGESQKGGRKRQHLNDLAWHPLTIKAIGCPCRTSASRDRQPDQGGATIARTPKAARPLSVGWTFSVNIERQVGVRLKLYSGGRRARS